MPIMNILRHMLSAFSSGVSRGQMILPSRLIMEKMYHGVVVYFSFLEAKALMCRLCQFLSKEISIGGPAFWCILLVLAYAMTILNFQLIGYMWKMLGKRRGGGGKRSKHSLATGLFDSKTTRSGRVYGYM